MNRLDLLRDLEHVLLRATGYARVLADNLEHGLDYYHTDVNPGLDVDRSIVHSRSLDLGLYRAREVAGDVASALDVASHLIGGLAGDLAGDLADAHALFRNIERIHDLLGILGAVRNRASDFPSDHASDLIDRVESAAFAVSSILVALDRLARDGHGTSDPVRARRPRVARVPRRLVAVAARLLPVCEQADYADEFAGDLAEIAGWARHRRRAQWAYALRTVGNTPSLRRALIRAARQPAVRG